MQKCTGISKRQIQGLTEFSLPQRHKGTKIHEGHICLCVTLCNKPTKKTPSLQGALSI